MSAPARWALVAVAALTILVGCGDGDGGSPPAATVPGLPAPQVDDAVKGLCQAREEAGGDVNGARTTFYDRSHEPLHVVARALEPVDRPLAGRLLEAKEAVEADLASPSRAPALSADLDRLLEVTRASLSRLSVAAPSCP